MIEILGIRHHGVGSARRVLERLEEIKPDIILVEGPQEQEEILKYIGASDLTPPVAVLLYDSKNVDQSTFYPFAKYSPEWIASKYANENKIPTKCIDLPTKISFATHFDWNEKPILKTKMDPERLEETKPMQYKDPISYLSALAGYKDSESWWEYHFEKTNSQHDAKSHFEAVMLAMKTLRDAEVMSSLDPQNKYREAYMRQQMRIVINEMYSRIVVICGAWHAPELLDLEEKEKTDSRLLKQLPKPRTKINASWIPWTNSRLSMRSGYGAGIMSPGWYEHLWETTDHIEVQWLSKVAEKFRKEGKDISTAHVLEAYKLCMALCQLRGKSHVSLNDLNESILTVMCMGDGILLELIKRDLIIGEKIGKVPDEVPKVPLQLDFEQLVKKCRLKLSPVARAIDLDLRKKTDLFKSVFLHRLRLLDISWAESKTNRSKGTFKESWVLTWSPEMMIQIIDNAYRGNTIEAACLQKINETCRESTKITKVTALLNQCIPAELHDSISTLLNKIDELSAISSDIQDLIEALPRLIRMRKYGDVRKSDLTMLSTIIDRLLLKVFINLKNACYGLDEDNSNKMFEWISKLQGAIHIHNDEEITNKWHESLYKLLDREGIHHIIQGCACRLLLDAEALSRTESHDIFSYALSTGEDPRNVAAWVEGFLRGSGLILIYDNTLWNLLYMWIAEQEDEQFVELLPYLRRAFSKYEHGERKQIGAKAKKGLSKETAIITQEDTSFQPDLANQIWNTLDYLIGNNGN